MSAEKGNGQGNGKPNGRAVGRPTKYDPAYVEQVEKLCLLGATDPQVADFFGVAVSTIHKWVGEHEEFSEARKRGKTVADARVAESLFNRACGYEHPAVKIFQHDGETFEHEYTKKYPPDTTAAIFWLKNRRSDVWRDQHNIKYTQEVAILHVIQQLPPAEAERLVGLPDDALEDELKRLGSG